MNYFMPTSLVSGRGSVTAGADALCALGTRCLIVAGRSGAKKSGALDDVLTALSTRGVESAVFDAVTPNPTVEICREAGLMAARMGAEFIVGIGGGSALDSAKVAAVFAANPGLDESGLYSREWAVPPLPVALVGTTSGTGSEVTSVAVLTDSQNRKHSIHDDRLYAALAFGDATYTLSMPRAVTVSTAVDALAHCVESYFNKKADEISRAFSVRGARMFLAVAESSGLFENELSFAERETLYNASVIGGLAINTTGTCFPHNVGYYLTEKYAVPHGTAGAVFMPELLAHAKETDAEYFDAFFESLGTDYEAFVNTLTALMPKLDVAMTAQEISAVLPRWENNNSVNNTVGSVGCEKIRKILTEKFVCGRE